VLLASFGLEPDPGLMRLAALVHYLDVGGLPVAEAAGLEAVLAGLRAGCPDDDALLAAASPVLDALHRRFLDARRLIRLPFRFRSPNRGTPMPAIPKAAAASEPGPTAVPQPRPPPSRSSRPFSTGSSSAS